MSVERVLFGRLLAPDDRGMCVVRVADGRVAAIEPAAAPPPEAIGDRASRIIPGLIDIQVNGAFGHDFSDPAADLPFVARALPGLGVTTFLPTVITSRPERTLRSLKALEAGRARLDASAARVPGVHLEGPFLAPAYRGTHDPAVIRAPDLAEALSWLDAAAVRIVTMAPELPGALAVLKALDAQKVRVAIGHSGATWDEAAAAADAGAALGTHLFNAMRPFHHRDPGVAGFLLASGLPVSVIADGRHLALETVALVARAVGPRRLITITDALAGLGMRRGPFMLAGEAVHSDGTVAHRADGTLSGSVLPLPLALRNLVAAGISEPDAVRTATSNPAQLLGLSAELGQVAVGRPADLVVLDEAWSVTAALVGGELARGAAAVAA